MALQFPEYLQTKSYSAFRDRLAFAHGGPIQAGVWTGSDYLVQQRGGGANWSVDILGGFAVVRESSAGTFYHIQNDATVNVAVAASNATNPRIDQVVLTIHDSISLGSADDVSVLQVVTGTPTAGATLDNRSGAAALPVNSLLLGDVLVPANSGSVTTANIRDRRAWARGALHIINLNSGGNYTTTAVGHARIDTTNLQARIECGTGGWPVRLGLYGVAAVNALGDGIEWGWNINGSLASGWPRGRTWPSVANLGAPLAYTSLYLPSIGSNLFAPTWSLIIGGGGNTATLQRDGTYGVQMVIEEVPRPPQSNGVA